MRFGSAVERLLEEGYDTFVELGPGTTLPGPVRSVAAGRDGADRAPEVLALAAPGAGADAGEALLTALGRLWTRGVELDHAALGAGRARVAVPTYPFQRRRYWPGPVAAPPLHRLTWGDAPPSAEGDTTDAPRAVRLPGPTRNWPARWPAGWSGAVSRSEGWGHRPRRADPRRSPCCLAGPRLAVRRLTVRPLTVRRLTVRPWRTSTPRRSTVHFHTAGPVHPR